MKSIFELSSSKFNLLNYDNEKEEKERDKKIILFTWQLCLRLIATIAI